MGRYTLDLGDIAEDVIESLAIQKAISKVEVLRRAVATYKYLVQQVDDGHRISVTDTSGIVVKEVELP